MANTRFQGNVYTLEKFPVALWGYCTSDDYSAIASVTTDIRTANRSKGIDWIYYLGTAKFKVGLSTAYHSLLYADAVCEVADSSVASMDIKDDSVSDSGNPYATFQLLNHSGAAFDLGDDVIVRFKLVLRNSSPG